MGGERGFLTPTFGVIAFGLALTATALTQAARTEDIAARRSVERLQAQYEAEGVATVAAWRILHEEGEPSLHWRESGSRQLDVWAEPEARKLSLNELTGARGRKRLERLVGQAEAERLSAQLLNTGAGSATRQSMLAASDAREWRRCGLTLVSRHSRLTDFGLTPARAPVLARVQPRVGEVWRIVVASDGRQVLDRLVRFTGVPARPVAILDQLGPGPLPGSDCTQIIGADGEAA